MTLDLEVVVGKRLQLSCKVYGQELKLQEMAGKVVSNRFRGYLLNRSFAAQAAVTKKADHAEKISLAKQDAKTTTLPNGLTVASIENYAPVSRIGVMVKAGPRYEPGNQLGISHCLRNIAWLATQKSSAFRMAVDLEALGSNLHASCSRENLFYELDCNRDHLDESVKYLAAIITQPKLHWWEVSDANSRIQLEVTEHNQDSAAILIDALHKAAFGGGLRNSLYSPEYMIGKHSVSMIEDYIQNTFGTNRTVIVGLGVDHDQLVDHVNKTFKFSATSGSSTGAAKYKGGDLYVDTGSPVTYAAVAAEGAGLNNQKDLLCLTILQKVLGEGSKIKYSEGATSKLGAVTAKATNHPFAVSGLNISYSDTGLFGFCVAGHPEDMDKILKELVKEMRTLKNVTAKDIAVAKQRVKACVHMSLESQSSTLEEMALSAITTGQLVTSSDLDKAIDAITAQDITAVANKVLKGKPSFAALGQLQKTPYLDELLL